MVRRPENALFSPALGSGGAIPRMRISRSRPFTLAILALVAFVFAIFHVPGRGDLLSGGAISKGFFSSPSVSAESLWTRFPQINTNLSDPDAPFWLYLRDIDETRNAGIRRASWGGINTQGAKSTLRQNLKDDMRYVIGDHAWGWNNQFISMCNLILLGKISSRIPILAPFDPHPHVHGRVTALPVSSIYDLTELRSTMDDDMPIIEAHELKIANKQAPWANSTKYDGEHYQVWKDMSPMKIGEMIPAEEPVQEKLGCWTWVWSAKKGGIGADLHSFRGVETEKTPIPFDIVFNGDNDPERSSVVEFAHLIRPGAPTYQITEEQKEWLLSDQHPIPTIPPEDHIACIDLAFFLQLQPKRFDIEQDYLLGDGSWNQVGRHLRFQAGLTGMAEEYLRFAFGLATAAAIPPFMAIHIRRGDFAAHRPYWTHMSPEDWLYKTWSVMETLREDRGIHVSKVILTTDETDPEFLQPFRDVGVHVVNHTAVATVDRFGPWLPTLLDNVLLSMATGFVGIERSTMSIMAYRRVVDWNRGVARMLDPEEHPPPKWKWKSP